jgi:hypothetical protein
MDLLPRQILLVLTNLAAACLEVAFPFTEGRRLELVNLTADRGPQGGRLHSSPAPRKVSEPGDLRAESETPYSRTLCDRNVSIWTEKRPKSEPEAAGYPATFSSSFRFPMLHP